MWTRASSRAATFLALAALVAVVRLPFLLIGDRFFDSDEAVEGLMARHVLSGEFPVMMWGQHYKGVPEIYPTAAIFALVGSSVIALKAATLGWFALFLCVQFVMLETIFSRRVAWLGSFLAIAVPPVMVQWSMSGNAEIVLIMLAGSALLLGWHQWRAAGAASGLALAGFAAGFGLWVQQFIIYYLVAVAVAELLRLRPDGSAIRRFLSADDAPAAVRWSMRLAVSVAALYLLLGFVAFAGGFATQVAGLTISVTHAQKMWRVAAALVGLAAVVGWLASGALKDAAQRRAWAGALAGFLAGYAPAVFHRLLTGGSGPVAGMNIDGFMRSIDPIATVIVPAIAGYRSGTTAVLDVPVWTAAIIALALVAAFVPGSGRRGSSVFHVFIVTTPLVFLASGAFVDAQSYRYLLPLFGALPVVFALGIDRLWHWRRAAGITLLGALAAVFAWQQVAWYRVIHPDEEASHLLRCISESEIRFAYAEYWLAYKLTFLTDERVIVAQPPGDGFVRYPRYQELVRAQEPVPTLTHPPPGASQPGCAEFVKM